MKRKGDEEEGEEDDVTSISIERCCYCPSGRCDFTMSRRCDVCQRLQQVAAALGGPRLARDRAPRDKIVDGRRVRFAKRCDASASSVVRWDYVIFDDDRRRYGVNLVSGIVKIAWILLALLALTFSGSSATELNYTSGVCPSIDIRNSVDAFKQLRGCRIIEGFLQIALIDRANESDYTNVTFPELVEITGHLLMSRVSGMRSVGQIFPNLSVIRGQSLVVEYAFVAFEMMHLQEIGLSSLTDILRGAVRFERNSVLCYIDTVDWGSITKIDKERNVIKANNMRNSCPVCDKDCPRKPTESKKRMCWNLHECSRTCPKECEGNACTRTGVCCHPSCLSGCTGTTEYDCTSCRDFLVIDSNETRRCADRCPPGYLEHLNYRCVTADECRAMPKPKGEPYRANPYKPFRGKCWLDCPAGYTEKSTPAGTDCIECEGTCRKECPGGSIETTTSARQMRGCTHVVGDLIVQIRGGQSIVKELEDSLGDVEVITGFLKIVRSFPLISLNFFKNLREIRGDSLENDKYTLVVLDNQNLQELWNWSRHRNFTLGSKDGEAKVFFHFNPKLCYETILELGRIAGLKAYTDYEVAPNSNGDKVPCNVTKLEARVILKWAEVAVIEWEPFVHHDPRSLLGYLIYSIEAPRKDVMMYDGRDACGGDGWRVDDVSAHEMGSPNQSLGTKPPPRILTGLKPYTQYAYYVKTYTIATERSGGQSDIQYFTTMPDVPSDPQDVDAISNSSSELIITWAPPSRSNGKLAYYRIVGRWEPDDQGFLAQRNYCNEPIVPSNVDNFWYNNQATTRRRVDSSETCECGTSKKDQSIREKEVSSSIAFEDALHNMIYVKRRPTRQKRDLDGIVEMHTFDKRQTPERQEPIFDKMINGTYVLFERLVNSTELILVMGNLKHYAMYNIEIQACRESVINDTNGNCSTQTMRNSRTVKSEGADDIPNNAFKLRKENSNESLPVIKLSWEEPLSPNGLIITYQIEYTRLDNRNIQATLLCVTRADFVNASHTYVLPALSSGNYSIRVRATSLAGNGRYTEPQQFYIDEYGRGTGLWTLFGTTISIVLLFVSFGTILIYINKSANNVPSRRLFATVNPEYMSPGYIPDEWEVPREKIDIGKELGNGSFGMVYEGLILQEDRQIKCAIKTVNETATERERSEFLNEASVMKTFHAHHVVKLLGVVSQGQPTLVLMELMTNGDLKTYLRSHRPDYCDSFPNRPIPRRDNSITLRRILKMAVEIADGMAYLTAKKYVHRDLAARNCMVAEDMTVKIGDFGMTRDVYETDYYRKGSKGMLPVRWMAPESLKDGIFTSYSDVWSYGVVLWEMVTLGSQPYQGLSNDEVLRYVTNGGVMERPENCPTSLYQLMRIIWTYQVGKRPTFIDLATILLEKTHSEEFEKLSFYHSPEGVEARNQNAQHSPLNDNSRNLSAPTLRYLLEEEPEGEDSPLKGDFGDFASYEPPGIKSGLRGGPRFALESFGENSKPVPNSSSAAGYDDASTNSSSKDTLNLPYAEDSLNSSYVEKNQTLRPTKDAKNPVFSDLNNGYASGGTAPR